MPTVTLKHGMEMLLSVLLLICGSWIVFLAVYITPGVPQEFKAFFPAETSHEYLSANSCKFVGSLLISCGIFGVYVVAKHRGNRRYLECFTCVASIFLIAGLCFLIATYLIETYFHAQIQHNLNNTQNQYYNVSSDFQPHAVVAWDNLQTSMKCCGIHSYKEWANVSDSPADSFIPHSCCRNQSDKTCSEQITYENLADIDFVGNFAYVDSCLPQGLRVQLIILISGLGLITTLLLCSPCSRDGIQ